MFRTAVLLVIVVAMAPGPSGAALASTAETNGGTDPAALSISAASGCSISQQCSGGGQVACSGPPGTCSSGSNWVECDGDRYVCLPPCEAQITCAYGGVISCDSSQTPNYHYCEEGSDYVYCEGVGTLTCDDCYPYFWCHIP